jgi:hypothetical protein
MPAVPFLPVLLNSLNSGPTFNMHTCRLSGKGETREL